MSNSIKEHRNWINMSNLDDSKSLDGKEKKIQDQNEGKSN
jgi:hypothetical protein